MKVKDDGNKVAEVGDIVRCKGINVVIGSIKFQEYLVGLGFNMEFTDVCGEYRSWKQWCDGGDLQPKEEPKRKTMGDLLNENPAYQEVVEHCLSYFAERLFDGGADEWAEIEMLCDDIGTDEGFLMTVFNALGYEVEDKEEE